MGHHRSLRVPVQSGLILHLWVHQGDAELPCKGRGGGGEASEQPWLGLGDAANAQRCPSCGIDRAWQRDGARSCFPSGFTGEAPGVFWGQGRPQGHGATSETLRAEMLALLPPARTPRPHMDPQGKEVAKLCPWGVTAVQGIVQGSASAPQNTALPGALSPQPRAHGYAGERRGQPPKTSSSSGVTARPEAQWGAEGFGVIAPKQRHHTAEGRDGGGRGGGGWDPHPPCATEGGSGPPCILQGFVLFWGAGDARPWGGGDGEECRVCRRGTRAGSCSGEGGSGSAETTGASSTVWGERCWAGGDTPGWLWGVTGDLCRDKPVSLTWSYSSACQKASPAGVTTPKRPKIPAGGGGRPGGAALRRGPARVKGRGYTSVRGHGQKVCQWDRMAPSHPGARLSRRSGGHRPATAEPRGRTVPQGHLHKGPAGGSGPGVGQEVFTVGGEQIPPPGHFNCRLEIIITFFFFNPFVVPFIS